MRTTKKLVVAAALAVLAISAATLSGCAVPTDGEAGLAAGFAAFVTHPVVSTLLFSTGLVALVFALNAPSFTPAAIVALAAFLLYFGGGLIAGYAQWWAVVLLAAGIGMLIGELFVPGFGLLGVSGIVCVALSLFFSSRDVTQFLISVAVALAALAVTFPLLSRALVRSKSFQKLVLNESVVSGDTAQKESKIGKTGVALTTLRPSGTIELPTEKEPERLSAIAKCGMIDRGEKVVVVEEDGMRVVVEREDGGSRGGI